MRYIRAASVVGVIMIGYRAALDLGNHTGMTKASGIVFWVTLDPFRLSAVSVNVTVKENHTCMLY